MYIMKLFPFIFSAVLLLFCSSVFSQTDKGTLLLGGGLTLSQQTRPPGRFSLNLYPSAGIFVADRIAIGAEIGAGVNFAQNNQNYTFRFVPNFNYYFGISEKLDVFLTAGFGGSVYVNNGRGNPTRTNALLSFNTGPNLIYFIKETIGLKLSLNYSGIIINDRISSYPLSLVGGFQIHLPRGEK